MEKMTSFALFCLLSLLSPCLDAFPNRWNKQYYKKEKGCVDDNIKLQARPINGRWITEMAFGAAHE